MRAGLSSELLIDIYAGCRDAARWSQALDRIRSHLHVRSAIVQLLEWSGSQFRQTWAARDTESLAHAAWHDSLVNNDSNPRLKLRYTAPSGQSAIMRDSDRFPPGSPDLKDLQQRLRTIGLGGAIGLSLDLGGGRRFSMLLHRAQEDARPFGAADEAFLSELKPHLEQAAVLSLSLGQAQRAEAVLGMALKSLRTGMVLIDGQSCIRWLNGAADAVIAACPALMLAHSRLFCHDPEDAIALAALLSGTEPQVAVIGRASVRPLQLASVPLDRLPDLGMLRTRGAVLLLCRGGDMPLFAAKEVATLFGLSAAEARLTAALASGETIAGYAARRGIAPATARTQLKQIFAKTNTRGQTDLVRHVCASVLGQIPRA